MPGSGGNKSSTKLLTGLEVVVVAVVVVCSVFGLVDEVVTGLDLASEVVGWAAPFSDFGFSSVLTTGSAKVAVFFDFRLVAMRDFKSLVLRAERNWDRMLLAAISRQS